MRGRRAPDRRTSRDAANSTGAASSAAPTGSASAAGPAASSGHLSDALSSRPHQVVRPGSSAEEASRERAARAPSSARLRRMTRAIRVAAPRAGPRTGTGRRETPTAASRASLSASWPPARSSGNRARAEVTTSWEMYSPAQRATGRSVIAASCTSARCRPRPRGCPRPAGEPGRGRSGSGPSGPRRPAIRRRRVPALDSTPARRRAGRQGG